MSRFLLVSFSEQLLFSIDFRLLEEENAVTSLERVPSFTFAAISNPRRGRRPALALTRYRTQTLLSDSAEPATQIIGQLLQG